MMANKFDKRYSDPHDGYIVWKSPMMEPDNYNRDPYRRIECRCRRTSTPEFFMNAGRELDALVAEKVMGLGCIHPDAVRAEGGGGWIVWGRVPAGDCAPIGTRFPAYSTDIGAAWEVVVRMAELFPQRDFLLVRMHENAWWEAQFTDDANLAEQAEPTAPLAICLAALRAVGVEVK